MADFTWKQGDTGPAFFDTLTYDDGSPVNLTGATNLTFEMRSLATAQALTLGGSATIVSAGASQVSYTPSVADTAIPGNYLASWHVTLASGTVETFPTTGFRWGSVEPNLLSAPQLIVDLVRVKEHLGITNVDRVRDSQLISLVSAVTPIIESQIGPVIPRVYEEWHDGGSERIRLLRQPATGFGTVPVLNVIAASEYRGPIEYPLSLVASPVFGSIYSVFADPLTGDLTRRTAGGRTIAFMPGLGSVHVFYQAGLASTPENVAYAAGEAIRAGFLWRQQVGRGRRSPADEMEVGPELNALFARTVRMWLAPNRRAPSFA